MSERDYWGLLALIGGLALLAMLQDLNQRADRAALRKLEARVDWLDLVSRETETKS